MQVLETTGPYPAWPTPCRQPCRCLWTDTPRTSNLPWQHRLQPPSSFCGPHPPLDWDVVFWGRSMADERTRSDLDRRDDVRGCSSAGAGKHEWSERPELNNNTLLLLWLASLTLPAGTRAAHRTGWTCWSTLIALSTSQCLRRLSGGHQVPPSSLQILVLHVHAHQHMIMMPQLPAPSG